MFSVDRYDPGAAQAQDKQSRLSHFNDRLKRKRSSVQVNSSIEAAAPVLSVPSANPVLTAVEKDEIESTTDVIARRPHREKKVKTRKVVPEPVEEDLGQSKVSHILKTFHKIQDRNSKDEPTTEPAAVEADAEVEVADLAPVPQRSRTTVKRSAIPASAGLPEYLRKPNIISSIDNIPFSQLPLCKKLQDNLRKCEFENAFAVQATLLPVLLEPHLPEVRQDLLVSAPTGSGKTLTYVLPILQTLQSRRITRLRAIVIVPTRELVQQVQATFESLSSKLGLQIEALSATRPFATEQALLVNDYEPMAPSNVDILICTPGRLVDHIKSTPRFTLRDLRFLVIDEGDRLLNQSFQGWSALIDEALKPLSLAEEAEVDIFQTRSRERCQKLIFSATLSTDPSLLSQLNLIDPALYLVQHTSGQDDNDHDILADELSVSKFTTPATLDEYFCHVPQSVPKPLVLLTAIQRLEIPKALVFTNTNESAIKLAHLMSRLGIGRCEAITSTLTPAARRRHLSDFTSPHTTTNGDFHGKNEEIQFLVCSDLMARGIDTVVPCVLNYDSSVSVRQYIHRVGRTARAGKRGRAVSLVEGSESKYWWNQIGKKVKRLRPVERVTLFPKPRRRIVASEEQGVQVSEREESEEHDEGDEDDEDDEIEQDGDEAMQDVAVTEADGKTTQANELPKHASRPQQVQLKEVDMDQLRNVYESALSQLQRGD